MLDFATARTNMVESQLRTNRVSDPRVIAAFETLPRERFLPEHLRPVAYVDEDLRIAPGRYAMEPMVLGRLVDHAQVAGSDTVLVVGAGCGYACAVLARLAARVVGLESDEALADSAERVLGDLGGDTVSIVRGGLPDGWPAEAPYDVILVNGAVAEVPAALRDQLADGGRLMAVLRDRAGIGRGTLFERVGEAVGRRTLFDAGTPVLPGFERAPGFVF